MDKISTKGDLETRVKENFRNIKKWRNRKSAVTAHVWKEKHTMDCKTVLLKQSSNKQELTNWENITKKTKKQKSNYKC